MVKLIIGVKGTGKTKQLIELANNAGDTSNGSVVCIEKGNKLIHEINHKVRLVDTDEYLIFDAQSLYGFISGMVASNSDITEIFVDSALKICGNKMADFEKMVADIDKLVKELDNNHKFDVVMTSSIPFEEATEAIKAYVINA